MTTTHDSWFNPTTGVGGSSDKTSGFTFGVGSWMSWDVPYLLDELYRADELARVKVDAVVDDAFMKGWTVESDLPPEYAEKLIDFNDRMGITQAVIDADKWARLFGGAAVFMGHEDTPATQDMPLQLGGRLCFAQAYERSELQVARWYEDPMSPKFGRPSHYRLSPYAMSGGGSKAATNSDIHESRFLLFYGDRATKRQRVDAQGWGQSVLLRCMTALKQYNGAYALMLSLLADANQNIYKLEGFGDLLRNGQGDLVQKRIEIIDKFRSATKALIVDAKNEDFVRSSLSLSGLDNIVTKYTERVASAFEMPLTRLFGVSPAGLNATGESDLRTWNKQVENHRTTVVTPQLDRWLRVALHAKNGPTGGLVPSSFKVKWPSLWDMSPREEAEVDSINAQTDRTYQELGILKGKHIASRFTGDRLRPSLSKEDVDQLEADEQLTVPTPPLLDSANTSEDVDDVPVDDEPDVDHDLLQFVAEMNAEKAERCPHGKLNRCRICGIESVRNVSRGADGALVFTSRWRPIGSRGVDPNAGRTGQAEAGQTPS